MEQVTSRSYHCLPACFAMVLGCSLKEMLNKLGHDGLKIVANEPVPNCFQGFHPQEFIKILLDNGLTFASISKNPMLMHGATVVDHSTLLNTNPAEEFYSYLDYGDCVLLGFNERGIGHAVVWDSEKQIIRDPRGRTYPKSDLEKHIDPKFIFVITKVNNERPSVLQ